MLREGAELAFSYPNDKGSFSQAANIKLARIMTVQNLASGETSELCIQLAGSRNMTGYYNDRYGRIHSFHPLHVTDFFMYLSVLVPGRQLVPEKSGSPYQSF